MPVEERLMKPGIWNLSLIPETPKAVRDVLQPFGHIVIHEARVDPRIIADADLLSTALYVGPVHRTPTPFSLSGAGMTIWLGDEEGKGRIGAAIGPFTQTFAAWMTSIINAPTPKSVTAGTITAVGAGTVTQTFTRVSQRVAADWICAYFTGLVGTANPAEYRVNNNGTLDAGLSSALFVTTPTAIVMPREGSRDTGLVGIDPTTFNLENDADSYTTDVTLVGAAGNGAATVSPATTYKDLQGNLIQLVRVVSSPQTAAGQENSVATAQLALYPLRQVVTLTTDRYDIPHDLRAGDWIYAYDPEHDLVDLTNPQNYRGQTVYPVKLRVFACAWPVEAGMGVYYRDGAAAYTDLTPWVQFEPPGTSFELGAASRTLTF